MSDGQRRGCVSTNGRKPIRGAARHACLHRRETARGRTEVIPTMAGTRRTPMHMPLTSRQYDLLMWITTYVTTHGYAPSLEEIGAAFGLRSLATVHKHMVNLEMKGHIKRHWNRARSIELIAERRCPYCGQVPPSLSSIQNGAKVVDLQAGGPAVSAADPP